MFFWLADIDEVYSTGNFIIDGHNVDVVLENGLLDKVEVGDTITFTSAPRLFWSDYFRPIIHISTSEEEILNLQEGYKNLMDMF